ncbi:vascular non-inflammatory molecule 3 [Trichonephila inaurata madagascariensis]|uniref:Vascular non-inflammatory molecule 3 n=1 Tax=Trichonephila inaurata madagascariensis TaxID=2747483 RepID=A0A8X7CAR7_9ARAC|nr:vascular non-inflammatory molecule 3 [Trichonephila inaurata madagascariensis]
MPKTGTLGSGIYSAHKGALIYTHNPDFRTKLLISNVPRSLNKESANSIELNEKKFYLESGAAIEVVGEKKRNETSKVIVPQPFLERRMIRWTLIVVFIRP